MSGDEQKKPQSAAADKTPSAATESDIAALFARLTEQGRSEAEAVGADENLQKAVGALQGARLPRPEKDDDRER